MTTFSDRNEGPNPEVTLGRHTTMKAPPAERTQKENSGVTAGRHVTNDDGNRSTITIEPDPSADPKYTLPVDQKSKPLTTT